MGLAGQSTIEHVHTMLTPSETARGMTLGVFPVFGGSARRKVERSPSWPDVSQLESERPLECLWGGRLAHVRLGGPHRRERHVAFSRRTWPLPKVEARNREHTIVQACSTVRHLPPNYRTDCLHSQRRVP